MTRYEPAELPPEAQRLCRALAVPARLEAHLRLVHDVARTLVTALAKAFPALVLDVETVYFGAATHDLGKVLHPGELTGPGSRHEEDGPALLVRHGVTPGLARFARTHGAWSREPELALEDLIIALADSSWKGRRDERLETLVTRRIAERTQVESWEAFARLDEILQGITADAEQRLAWQLR